MILPCGPLDPPLPDYGSAMTEGTDHIGATFIRFGEEIARTAPTYGAICRGVADNPEVLSLLDGVPEPQRRPVLLLAAVHFRLLGHPDEPLARHYRTINPQGSIDDPVPDFTDFCSSHADALRIIISSRTTQTNDVGRAALILPTLRPINDRTGGPLGLIDIGTSAGLNLHLDRYAYRYHDTSGGERRLTGTGPELDCLVRGAAVEQLIDATPPQIVHRIGVDPHPIDPSDPDEARWLLACLWPDQTERVGRLREALAVATANRNEVEIHTGSGVELLSDVVGRSRARGCCPVVINTWSLTYFTPSERVAYVEELDRLGTRDDLAWVYLEAPNETPELPWGEVDGNISLSVLRRVDWKGGRRTERTIGIAHPHGRWIEVTEP